MNTLTLTRDQIREKAPAVFSDHPDPNVTQRYKFVNTKRVLDKLEDKGLFPIHAEQCMKRVNPEYGFHLIRLQHKLTTSPTKIRLDQIIPQMVLSNSHDRTRRFELTIGMERLICTNGMTAPVLGLDGEAMSEKTRVLHLGENNIDGMIDTTLQMAGKLDGVIRGLMDYETDEDQQRQLAKRTIKRVYGTHAKTLDYVPFLAPSREEDEGAGLWLIFNRLQENIMKGGVITDKGRTTGGLGERATATGTFTRARFNEHLWIDTLAMQKYGELSEDDLALPA